MNKYYLQVFIIVLLFACAHVRAQQSTSFAAPDRIKFDETCLQIEGKDVFIYSGAFHYFRVPKALWKDRFQKLKEAGFNAVESYVPWNYHEYEMPKSPSDFSKIDLSELEEWMSMAEQFGFYTIIRPGPYICAEWDGGGFPQWLLKKKPGKITREAWLQSDDPEFLKWNQHWYEAVCKVVAPHQLTKKKVGEKGVILFQIENEYERVNWFPKDMKRKYLEDLVVFTRGNGIDVPIFTCWTTESRGVKEGPLAGVFDFVNSYPRWQVRKTFGGHVDTQLKTQPGFPLMSAELQGGWYAEVDGQLSKHIDGVAPIQTQNLALYAIQRGFSLINFYMLVGGTNFDDWASRETTTTYDFAAMIEEGGGVGDKYRRLQGIGHMLQEHGSRLVRAQLVDAQVATTDSVVEVTLKKAQDGGRYYFVRTDARNRSFFGTATVKEKDGITQVFDYSLEPFGAQVYYIPAGKMQGSWYPKLAEPKARPAIANATIVFDEIAYQKQEITTAKWKKLKPNQSVDDLGIYHRHFIHYKMSIPEGKQFVVHRIGDKLINNSKADEVLVQVNNQFLKPVTLDQKAVTFAMPAGANEAIILFENRGLHHHTKRIVEDYWSNGLNQVTVDGKAVPLQFASLEKQLGLDLSNTAVGHWKTEKLGQQHTDALLSWYKVDFELPSLYEGVWAPWHVDLQAKGNGFIYLNGHCLGRYWSVGPQTRFFLPENWLKKGVGEKNTVVISLRPVDGVAQVDELTVYADQSVAEVINDKLSSRK